MYMRKLFDSFDEWQYWERRRWALLRHKRLRQARYILFNIGVRLFGFYGVKRLMPVFAEQYRYKLFRKYINHLNDYDRIELHITEQIINGVIEAYDHEILFGIGGSE